ncbi:hypothetical protein GCM10012286_14680 [Streptomyces lasiicapitis]|uniref:Uncharacterized protein n=1 Tax=Streptomyces lasiicapitis TaxID=1923961 RepID=A0ABQ2LKZ8_9ACTN|nr:hypothetical protein GCM10012286_14680 [Streptomyces lasiicapitis]
MSRVTLASRDEPDAPGGAPGKGTDAGGLGMGGSPERSTKYVDERTGGGGTRVPAGGVGTGR